MWKKYFAIVCVNMKLKIANLLKRIIIRKVLMNKNFLIHLTYPSKSENVSEFSMSAERVIVNRERQSEMELLILKIKNILEPQEYEILIDKFLHNKSLRAMKEKHDISHQTVHRKLKKIIKKIQVFKEEARDILDFDVLFYSGKPKYYPSFSTLGLPVSLYSKVGISGYRHKGSYHWNKTKCVIPEYLEECFQDNKTVCNLCNNEITGENRCTRKKYYSAIQNVTKIAANGIIYEREIERKIS